MIQTDTLISAMRQLPYLSPEDSLHRAVEMLRYTGATALPVVNAYGELLGVADMHSLRALLAKEPGETDLAQPVGEWMRRPGGIGHVEMTLSEVRDALAASGETTLIIIDEGRRYVGTVSLADLLAPTSTPPRPASVGGMATPWGVYLTNGSQQAGVGNLALVGSGALMGVMLILSYAGIGAVCWLAQKALGWPLLSLWNAEQPPVMTLHNAGWFLLKGLSFPLFLIMMRLLPLSGYHAAEHQAVHAMERGELLHPDVLRRLPRVHPRCGTNILAGGLIFSALSQVLPALHIGLGSADSAVVGALFALFTWRSVGAFLQQYFTTRPANDRQLASGIHAAEELQRKFLMSGPRRPNILRRLWCMGMPQMMIGTTAVTTAVMYLFGI